MRQELGSRSLGEGGRKRPADVPCQGCETTGGSKCDVRLQQMALEGKGSWRGLDSAMWKPPERADRLCSLETTGEAEQGPFPDLQCLQLPVSTASGAGPLRRGLGGRVTEQEEAEHLTFP